jgi:REP element-mobilizing transposase RayT
MPNHVHVAYTALGLHAPDEIHHSWKSYTSHKINKLVGRSGTLWEREAFDHLIRSVEHYEAFVEYIERNPVAAGLCESPEQWPYSSAGCEAWG